MKDQDTADLFPDAPVPKRRGRPPLGDAPMTAAQKQRAYRERKKAQPQQPKPILYTREQVQQAVKDYQDIIDKLNKKIHALEVALAKKRRHRDDPPVDVDFPDSD